MVPVVSFHVHLDLSHKLFDNEVILLGYESFIHARLINDTNLDLCTHSWSLKLILTWGKYCSFELSQGVYICFWINGCPSMDVHQCNKVDFPCCCFVFAAVWLPFIPYPLLPLHLESTLLGVKDILHTLSVSRGMRLWETDLQNCLNNS